MTKLSAMPLFWAEFFADTAHMTNEAAKAYLFLLGHAWLRGAKLPADDAELYRMARVSARQWASMRDSVMGMWTLCEDGFYRQKRLQKEYDYVSHRAEVNRQNGARGGRPRANEIRGLENPPGFSGFAGDNPERTQKNPPTPTPTLVSIQKPTQSACDAYFDRFRTAYPKRDGSNPWKPARDRFRAACKSGVDPETILAGADSYRLHCEAKGIVGTAYVAQAQTWLSQQRWADDYTITSAANCRAPPNGGTRSLDPMMAAFQRKFEQFDDHDGQDETETTRGTVPGLPAPGARGH